VHSIEGPDNDTQLKLLQQARKAFEAGNERIKYTTPAIITASLKLARKLKSREHFEDNWQTQSSTLYRFMHQTLSQLYTRVNPAAAELCLRLFVSCGQIADQCGFEEFAYEFLAQAFTIYEDSISDSRAQFQAVCIIAGALQTSRGFGKENYDTLITKAALHGSKLLKKPDQCRAVYLASHLWWCTEIPGREEDPKDVCWSRTLRSRTSTLTLLQFYRDGKRVLECLQRALRVADACMDTAVSVELFVEILNRYVYYFDQQNETVSAHVLVSFPTN
jgi:vacuolar protein sorting-associated protein 35